VGGGGGGRGNFVSGGLGGVGGGGGVREEVGSPGVRGGEKYGPIENKPEKRTGKGVTTNMRLSPIKTLKKGEICAYLGTQNSWIDGYSWRKNNQKHLSTEKWWENHNGCLVRQGKKGGQGRGWWVNCVMKSEGKETSEGALNSGQKGLAWCGPRQKTIKIKGLRAEGENSGGIHSNGRDVFVKGRARKKNKPGCPPTGRKAGRSKQK